MGLVSFGIFAAFTCVWYVLPYRKQGENNRQPGKVYIKAILLGLIPAAITLLALQILVGFPMRAMHLTEVTHALVDSIVSAAIIEEGVKFFFAWLVVRKLKDLRKIDYALIFGAVGLGYEIIESIALIDSVVGGILRGVFASHIFWQYWMGLYFFEYLKAKDEGDSRRKKKNLLIIFLVPILLHAFNDFTAFALDFNGSDTQLGLAVLGLILSMILIIIFTIITYRMVLREAKKSREVETLEEKTEITDGED